MPISPAFGPVSPGADAEVTAAVADAAAESTADAESSVEAMAAAPSADVAPAAAELEEEPDPVGGLVDVQFQHVRFTYDTTVAHNWTVEYAANPPADGEAPSFYTGPVRLVFQFDNYPTPLNNIEPVIYVYRIADISSQNEYKVANLLGALLAKSAPLNNYKSLPFLPLIAEEQSIIAQPKFIPFQSGSGIRYLTIVGDASEPFLSNSVWYTFQGLTSDNKFYVAAVFPLAANMFPDVQEPDYDPTAFADRLDEYLLLSKAALNLAPRSAFTPRLSRLDALVESIQIVEEQ
ncbi:MAG: hypothetical protein R2911_00715 [Caldilineaceae bacterium]